ncbi:MAG: citrate lyase acyl carrier protein [Synergistaceae bacterium]|jgi:citrate lyase subunit gamma (acyl carrier protein)|nr:citrate lyase acyl carrier protein [Synergistaceae bacterium]
MEIINEAEVGTIESGDAKVTVAPLGGEIVFELQSSVINQYGRQIRRVVMETLRGLGVTSGRVSVVDRGALDCAIKARVECAVFRSSGFDGRIPWGGEVK